MSVKQHIQSIAIGAALFTLGALGAVGCGGGDSGPLSNVDSLVILQRPKRNKDVGNVFAYTSYKPGARLVQLKPPTANGALTTLCCDQDADFKDIDISGYDLSFDAKTIVFSARRGSDPTFGLFLLQLSDGKITQVATHPMQDYVSPIFLPGGRILFMTNERLDAGDPDARQHHDEYDRDTASQLGRVNVDGTNLELGARNLSHRSYPSLASDGRVIFTQWDHLGTTNEANLMFVNQDMQELREGFGKEGKSAANSHLKAREISPGRLVAIATARDRTIQSGMIVDIRLGDVENHDGVVSAPNNQSEAHSTFRSLTPDVPPGNDPSADTIGRYYDAFPLNAKDKPDLLVSWADGPVESEVLALAGLSANYGIYLFDSEHQQRRPILDDPDMWDIFARPLATRTAPPVVNSAQDPRLGGSVLVGSLNVYDSTLHTFKPHAANTPGEIYGVRVMEGFSSEEGFPTMFGTTMFEGHANLGVAPVALDGSWSATIPANIPVHMQAVDGFGMSLFNEPVWVSGRPGEARVCGGCHESRTQTTTVTPGLLDTFANGATRLMSDKARGDRIKLAPVNPTDIVGVAWDKHLQPIFDQNCVTGCHDAANSANVPGYSILDAMGNKLADWHLDLSGTKVPAALAVVAGGGAFTASYFSMAGPDPEAIERAHLTVVGPLVRYMKPLDAAGSIAIQKLNPTQLFPTVDATKHAFPGSSHLKDKAGKDLTPTQFYLLILAADMGVNFYARENNPMVNP
jgi:hypothetical protein